MVRVFRQRSRTQCFESASITSEPDENHCPPQPSDATLIPDQSNLDLTSPVFNCLSDQPGYGNRMNVPSIVTIFFFYGLAFFSMGLAIALEGGRGSDVRLRHGLRALALFGLIHGAHEWAEMFERLRSE